MSAEIDQLTLARARRGDSAALGVLVQHYQRPVYALVGRLLFGRSVDRVDDVAQDAFMRVCRGLPRFDPDGPARLSTWILTIATRTCLNHLRDNYREEPRPSPADGSAAEDDPEQTAADRERRRRVESAMRGLPADLRAVLVLRGYHDFDYDEIAQALGIEVGTVKSRLGRARAALRTALGEKPTDEEKQRE
jgi:RNA polymerase sigma-70 factor (ECF subfamily)